MRVDSTPVDQRFIRWGKTLIGLCVTALGIGGSIVSIFFSHMLGKGVPAPMCFLLVPIWSVGALGIILLVAAWFLSPRTMSQIEFTYSRRSDGRYFGTLVRVLACFTLTLFFLVTLSLVYSTDAPEPFWVRFLFMYIAGCVWAFTLHLSFMYIPDRHLATTTLVNLLGPVFAYLLFPVLWPALLWFNMES
jgi:hypothetical protein